MSIMRQTNRRLIDELLPVLKKALEDIPTLDKTDYYGYPYTSKYIDGIEVSYTSFGTIDGLPVIWVEASKPLRGKYDHASVQAKLVGSKVETYAFTKEFAGKGNGYYAKIDENGKILHGEWD